MAQIVKPAGATTKKTIVGRGYGSKGRCCGRGNNGQNSRSGGGVRLGFEGGQMPLYRRVARRGFSNARFKVVYEPISLAVIDKAYAEGETVSAATLLEKGVANTDTVKILADGEVTKKLVVDGVKLSGAAAEKIKAAGGEVK